MGKTICVYCASSSAVAAEYLAEARALGAALATRGHTLVYGGGSIGLMGEMARAALAGGGRVIGVIPKMMVDRELALRTASELVITEDMHERKATMARRADGFIALPGGFGTFEEITEIIAFRQLALHSKPCVLVNVNDYYGPLIEQFERAFRLGFAREAHRGAYAVVRTALEALDLVENHA